MEDFKNKIDIVEKSGWKINSDDALVNSIVRALIHNDGHCPSKRKERIGHDQCPCHEYLCYDNCYCGLYVKTTKEE